ncbi:MAG: hypothetical protein EOP64_05730, partial [Sphingomonas sp.]
DVSVGFTYGKTRPSYIDSLGEKRSDYTIDEDSGLFVQRPASPRQGPGSPMAPTTPVKGESSGSAQSPPPPDSMEGVQAGGGLPREGAVKIDGTVYFTGKPEELGPLWLHMFEKAALDPNMSTDQKKCAYLATRFQGPPRDWLVQLHETRATVFADYPAFVESIKTKYGRHEEVQTQLDQRKMASLHQTGDAATFIQEFNELADKLSWNDTVRSTIILQKIKKPIYDYIILHEGISVHYRTLCEDIAKNDALISLLHPQGTTSKKSKRKKKGKTQTCGNCGKPGHNAEKCWSKKINMIRLRGHQPSPDSYQLDVQIGGHTRSARVDTGAEVNCIRANLATGVTYQTQDSLDGPTGQVIAKDAKYIVETIGGSPQRLYLVPGLVEEVLLGRPYLSGEQAHNMCAFATTGPHMAVGRLRQLSLPEAEALDAYLELAQSKDWIQPSNALQACNVLFVPKKNGKLRMCVDYRPLNEVTFRDGYPLPLIKSLLHQVIGSQVFSVIDLEAAFHLIRIMPGQEPLTAFRTPKGVFEYKVMPFGIKNGPSIFQRYIERILAPHAAYAKVYIDDVILHSDNLEDHWTHMEAVLQTLREHAIRVATDKTQAAQKEVTYLGHRVTHGVVEAIIDYKAVRDWPEPQNKTELQRYMGMANYWRDFIPGLASEASPLYALTGNDTFRWEMRHRQAFASLKAAICSDVENYQQDPTIPLNLFFDASGVGLGAVAFQEGRPISILSRGLSPAERNYTTTEREMLAIVWATKKWVTLIESTRAPVTVYTDHKLLTQNWNADYRNRRMNRWLEHLMRLPVRYCYVIGEENPADAPSRRPDFFPERGGEAKINKLVEGSQPITPFWKTPEHVTPIDKTPATPAGADPWQDAIGPTPEEVEAWEDYHQSPSPGFPSEWDSMYAPMTPHGHGWDREC